ncbi:C39 family peptidase [Nocardioides jensenii]|uniref:C39 family peptidase n=1 Tax=Nocardioides jensenii TaxID=1843 RepID=UPI0008315620|nr:C39 family peptidase [Nocardioides jensenii]
MNRRRSAAIGTFALVLASSAFLSGASASSTASSTAAPGAPAEPALPANATATQGRVTPAMQAEIDRVLAEGSSTSARRSAATETNASALATSQVRCADLEGQRYCLGTGWTDQPEADVVAEATAQTRTLLTRSAPRETTGDLDLADELRQRASMSPAARREVERAELVEAARSVAKVWLLRHQIQGTPLPQGFVERHPEIRAGSLPSARTTTDSTTLATTESATRTATKTSADYPERDQILSSKRVAEQTRTYWCGPTAMQMIGWGWRGYRNTQNYWATKLGTTRSGTAISEMVRVTNANTGFDNPRRAGEYVVLDIGSWTWGQWWMLQMRHIHDYQAPVILHPILLKKFYPYLDDDASGHFQVGRGYDKNGNGGRLLKYFEPWNQQRFDPSEPFISRNQTRYGYRSYRANLAHSMHNIGV